MDRRVVLPASLGEVEGNGFGAVKHVARFEVEVPFTCRPLRPTIPCIVAYDFDVVGIERRDRDGKVKSLWPDGKRIPAIVFSESFAPLLFDVDVGVFMEKSVLITVVENLNPGSRRFACGWVVEALTER